MPEFPLSVLDLSPIGTGYGASQSLRHSRELAQRAEALGYKRYWVAEHHNIPSVASSSPEVLIAHLAAHTSTIRLGSGGIMLPNHVPLRIAEAFLTLEALYPDRIDLGIGRAPGADHATMRALRPFDSEQYPAQLAEMMQLASGGYTGDHPLAGVRAIPDDVDLPPIWLLGSSGGTARLAGMLGTGYSFARHFSPAPPRPAIDAYRAAFKPSRHFPESHVILGVSVICAETMERAEQLASSLDLVLLGLRLGKPGRVPSPDEAAAYQFTPEESAAVRNFRTQHFIGTPDIVREQIEAVMDETGADEAMIASTIYDPADRMRSYELVAEAFGLTPP